MINNFVHNDAPLTSPDKAGIIFFENTLFNRQGRERADLFPLIITGSHWNQEILQNNRFSSRIETVIQGIDPTIFHPAPKSGLFKDRFVIFSEGKLEYRKGQDIVIAAFRIFQKRHPEALEEAYNKLLVFPGFWDAFPSFEYMLIAQLDAFVFRDNLDEWCRKGYAYIGAPWLNGFGANNTLSIQNIRKLLQCSIGKAQKLHERLSKNSIIS
ncbi:hypothetical protein KAI46_10130 [bacterium]|nr:hypothetical protein [bacterium]